MENNIENVASLEEIGDKLDRAQRETKTPIPEIMAVVGANPSAWYRWVNGANEAGCRQIAVAGLMLGIEPNDLLLKLSPKKRQQFDDVGADSAGLSAADVDDLIELKRTLIEVTRMGGDAWKRRPTRLLLEHAKNIHEEMRRQEARLRSIPAGTQIRVDDAGRKIYDAPNEGGAAEASAPYVKRKRKAK